MNVLTLVSLVVSGGDGRMGGEQVTGIHTNLTLKSTLHMNLVLQNHLLSDLTYDTFPTKFLLIMRTLLHLIYNMLKDYKTN